ncbi:MAG: rhodanese-like domain-containing protein [Thermodesulfovibrionia bacterium]|nr:rhodanese-like domain-containing protein [Thermodesulfovibrionia bacterium]
MEVKKNLMFKMMRNRSSLFFVIALLLIIIGPGCKPKPEQVQPNPHLLVTPTDIETNMGKWVVLDCRDKESYNDGHIPGAISLGARCHVLIRDTEKIIPIVGKMKSDYDFEPIRQAIEDGKLDKKTLIASLSMKPIEYLEKLFARAGITHDKTVVVYSDRTDILPGYHAVPFFTLEYLGHKDVRILDGGFDAWVAEGKSVEQKESKLPPSDFKAKIISSKLATTDEAAKIARGEIKDVQLVDSRLIDEYLGKAVSPPGHFLAKAVTHSGRIPNTVLNVPHFLQFADMKTLKLKPIEKLDKMYLPLDKNKKTVLYCYIANRISFSYFVLRLLGFKDIAIYHDSWIVYGNDDSLPRVSGPR